MYNVFCLGWGIFIFFVVNENLCAFQQMNAKKDQLNKNNFDNRLTFKRVLAIYKRFTSVKTCFAGITWFEETLEANCSISKCFNIWAAQAPPTTLFSYIIGGCVKCKQF